MIPKQKFADALNVIEKACLIHEEIGDFNNKTLCLSNMGFFNEQLDAYENTLELYQKAL